MMQNLPIRLRHANDTDVNFIFNSWLKSLRSSRNYDGVDRTLYYAGQHKVVEGLLKSCTVMMACSEQDPTQLYGYIVYEQVQGIFVLHYLYIKQSFRNLGIGPFLLKSAGHDNKVAAFITHRPFQSDAFLKRNNFVFNPFLAYHAYTKADEKAK